MFWLSVDNYLSESCLSRMCGIHMSRQNILLVVSASRSPSGGEMGSARSPDNRDHEYGSKYLTLLRIITFCSFKEYSWYVDHFDIAFNN